MASYFFEASQGAHEQLTLLYDFVWPTSVAMWNLRWQVQGFMSVCPDASDDVLLGRFAEGANIRGANLKRTCIEHTWKDQQEAFARVLLYNCFAIFEGWIANILGELGAHTKANEKGLQFPYAVPPKLSASDVITQLTATESSVTKSCFYHVLKRSKKYNGPQLANLLRCYRYFKEVRNSLMHAGSVATQGTVDAYVDYVSIARPSDLGMSESPASLPVVLGSRPEVSLRGVVGLSEVILRLVTTIDAELSRSANSEVVLERRWKKAYPKRMHSLSAEQRKRLNAIAKSVQTAGLPKPERPAALADFLKSRNLVWF